MTKELVKVSDSNITAVEYFGDTVIDQFIASRNASPNTARTYRNSLRQLFKHFAANGITQPAESDVNAFVASLRAAGKSSATLRLYTTVCKSFFSFTARKNLYANVAADVRLNLRKSMTHAKRALSNTQAQKLLASVTGNDLLAVRDRAIIALSLTCGLRTCEVSRANVGNLRDDGQGGAFLSVTGKGRLTADAEVRVPAPVAEMIDEYLNLRGEVNDDDPLFVSLSNQNRGVRLSVQSVGKLIARYMKIAGVKTKGISAHSTRHFAATTAIKAGIDLREVAQMMRHSNINVTMVYLHDISLETRRAEMSVSDSLFGGACA